ncbi:MAG: hypothetical protein KJO06_00195 [Gemmatimonadetes bacterium]|nr:hypothetical protein [Gemmatimonadota bacterium]NNK48814.1 hypothetical protein [Gemmatimonadota bacterium]
MIGRLEITEILGMAATCAVVLFAGFSVETLEGSVQPSWAVTVEVRAPDVPNEIDLPDELRLELPNLERPVHPAPPTISLDGPGEPVIRAEVCGGRHATT